ncbi:MAG: hypothetical protein IPO81_15915 [Kouleothrix sp.]|nr:hypothetical protein [Kouleothrix sp.]
MSEKATLIAHLESVDIPAGIFTVPGVSAYNEAAARSLLAHRQDQVDQGSLTPEQLEAFARLTVHERALSQMLPIYTSVAASLAETHIDIIRTSFGLLFVMQPAWNACQGTLPSCGPLQELSSRHLMTLARDASKLLARRATTEPGQQKNLVNAADLVARLVEDKLAGGQSLQELLLDKGAQFMLTTVMIGPYLGRTQQLLDRGVRTAELERPTDDRWPISGSTERAALNVEGLVTQADIHRQDALRRYQDFQQGADVTRVADDIAKLVTLSPSLPSRLR